MQLAMWNIWPTAVALTHSSPAPKLAKWCGCRLLYRMTSHSRNSTELGFLLNLKLNFIIRHHKWSRRAIRMKTSINLNAIISRHQTFDKLKRIKNKEQSTIDGHGTLNARNFVRNQWIWIDFIEHINLHKPAIAKWTPFRWNGIDHFSSHHISTQSFLLISI